MEGRKEEGKIAKMVREHSHNRWTKLDLKFSSEGERCSGCWRPVWEWIWK
jgi:hypothetical protein